MTVTTVNSQGETVTVTEDVPSSIGTTTETVTVTLPDGRTTTQTIQVPTQTYKTVTVTYVSAGGSTATEQETVPLSTPTF